MDFDFSDVVSNFLLVISMNMMVLIQNFCCSGSLVSDALSIRGRIQFIRCTIYWKKIVNSKI